MAKHRKFDLLDIVAQAVNECGWNILYLSDTTQHPFLLKIYNEDEGYLLRIYIWHLTHGGGIKRPKDEYRIQITGVERFEQKAGEKTLILGWWPEIGVFAGFDYNKHNGKLGASPSIQIKEESLRKAYINGISPYDKGNGEITVAFRPDFFVEYVRNLEQLHMFGQAPEDLRILEEVANNPLEPNEEIIKQVSKPRQTTVLTISKKLRDNSFKSRVLTAYRHKCAICELQLKLVDAAHILPVSHENSTDETCNGIVFCALHHRAYDISLVTFNEKYQVLYNRTRMKQLKEIGYDSGMNEFIKHLRPLISVPPAVTDRPHVDYITKANEIRGWDFEN